MRKVFSKRIFWSIRTASRKPTTKTKISVSTPKTARFVNRYLPAPIAEEPHILVKPRPIRAERIGLPASTRDVRQRIEDRPGVQPMKTKITVAIIGVMAIFAAMLRKSLIGGFAAVDSRRDGRGRLRHVGHVSPPAV